MKILKFIAGYIWSAIKTTEHRLRVLFNIIDLINALDPPNKWKLYRRGLTHDLSKYRWSEASYLSGVIFDLKGSTYGSDEYKNMLKKLKPMTDNHYKKNRHHPEHHKNGMADMTEIYKLEMIADWQSACKRHGNGCIYKSIEINQERFGYSDGDKEWLISMAKILE